MSQTIDTGKLSKSQVDVFLQQPILARFSTAIHSKQEPDQFQPHTVPVWFHWDGMSFYVSAFQSTRKVKEVMQNAWIALLIDSAEPVDGVTAVLAEGKSELILEPAFVQEMSRVIYTKYMGIEGVKEPAPQSWIIDPENAIVKLTVPRLHTW